MKTKQELIQEFAEDYARTAGKGKRIFKLPNGLDLNDVLHIVNGEEKTQELSAPDAPYIIQVCDQIKALLLEKNKNYGSSAFNPIHCFSKLPPEEGINIRIDDKLARISRGVKDQEDTELDLIGYLVLKRVLQVRKEVQDRQESQFAMREEIREINERTSKPNPF